MTALETLKDFIILLAQPRSRGPIRPGHPACHAGDFLGDLTKLEEQGRRALPRPHDLAAMRLTAVDEMFETVAQLGGKGAQLRQFDGRQGRRLVPDRGGGMGGPTRRPVPGPFVASGAPVDGAGADAIMPGNVADQPALEIVGLDCRPIDMALGPVVAF